jgi:hypothetical protein
LTFPRRLKPVFRKPVSARLKPRPFKTRTKQQQQEHSSSRNKVTTHPEQHQTFLKVIFKSMSTLENHKVTTHPEQHQTFLKVIFKSMSTLENRKVTTHPEQHQYISESDLQNQ